MNHRRLSTLLLLLSAGTFTLFGQTPKPKSVEQIVGPAYVPGTIYTLSSKGMRLASTHPKGSKFVVTIDGVEGPEFDQILLAVPVFETEYNTAGVVLAQTVTRQGPVAFSRDGKRYAYAGVRGRDAVVILDGREIFRAPHSAAAPPVSLLQFTPDGSRVFFYNQTADTMRSHRLMMDGKPVTPAFDGTPQPLFSDDGTRWLLSAAKAQQPAEKILIIDGKDAGYSGQRVRFTPDGKQIVCTSGDVPNQKLLVDGKAILSAPMIERFKVSATGEVGAIVRPSGSMVDLPRQTLYLNGKPVPNTEGVIDFFFSPDGKHWAGQFQRDQGTVVWVMLDGKKHKEYATIGDFTYSPDSSTFAYLAGNGTKQFMVTNGQEDEGHGIVRSKPTFAKTGNHFVYAAGPQTNALKIYHKAKPSKIHRNVFGLALSPDGERCAYFGGLDGTFTEFMVDGAVVTRDGEFGGSAFFSPDSKHVAAATRRPNGYGTIYIDGTFLPERLAVGIPREFTPDSRHLMVVGRGTDQNQIQVNRYYLDGDLVAEFSGHAVPWENSPKMTKRASAASVMPFGTSSFEPDPEAKPWEYMPDGTIVFVGPSVGPAGYGPMKKITVTPAPGTSFSTWLADVKVNEEKAAAEAEASKAAAAAKVKADAEAIAAKRKSDYDAAVAARTKARQDAIEARQKAQADAAAKRAGK